MKNQFFFETTDGQLDRAEMWFSLGIAGAAAILFMAACVLDFTVGRDQIGAAFAGKPPTVGVSVREIPVAESPKSFTNDTVSVVPTADTAVARGSRISLPRASGFTRPSSSQKLQFFSPADF